MAQRKRLRTRRSRVLVVAALVVVVALAAFFAYRGLTGSASAEVTYTTAAAQKMTLTSSVSGLGNVELSTNAVVSPTISGEVSGLVVAVGDTVREGQILFTLINPELDVALAQAVNSYNQAVLGEQQAELSVEQAEQSLEDLQDQYDSQSSGSSSGTPPSSIPFPSTTTTTTQPSTTTSTEPPSTTSTEPPSTTTDTTESTTSTTSLPSTTTTLNVSAVYDQQPVTVMLAAAVSTGGSVTELDIEAAEQQVESAKLSVVAAQNQVESAQLALEQAQEDAAAREVKAPMSGTVTALNIENGDTVGQSGANASATAADSGTLTITNVDAFQTTITLAESDISLVAADQKAVITFDALPDLTMTGKVTSVDTTGTNNQGVVSYNVVVVPDTTNPTVKGGMTVSVNIITAVATDVLAVPSAAVKSATDGSKYVQVLENEQPTDVTVEVGMSTDSYTEITSGLAEGQEVITQTITASSGDTATSTGNQGGNIFQQGGGGFPGGGGPGGGVFIGPGQ
jgi:RND family efflux transporter MFP subunit